jgi:hypothetical protein
VTDVFIWVYLFGWALTSVGLIVSSRWLSARRPQPPHPVAFSFLAGAAWPLLLLGVVEFGAVAAAAKIAPDLGQGIAIKA